ncbi:MAG: recombinase family protein [Actinobacteria bacterium]|nr:recombinase family protein [Actinomycetota bacterium]
MLFGYARVSTADQNPDHQIDALLRAGVAQDAIYVDRASGAKASRPQLDELLKLLRDGDTLKITRLDRLGRSVLHLVTLGAKLRDRGVGLHVIEQGIGTATAEGRAMIAWQSRDSARARQSSYSRWLCLRSKSTSTRKPSTISRTL